MNKDQIKGALKEVAGKFQEQAGRVMGSSDQKLKGAKRQVDGKSQKAIGDLKQVVKDAGHK